MKIHFAKIKTSWNNISYEMISIVNIPFSCPKTLYQQQIATSTHVGKFLVTSIILSIKPFLFLFFFLSMKTFNTRSHSQTNNEYVSFVSYYIREMSFLVLSG